MPFAGHFDVFGIQMGSQFFDEILRIGAPRIRHGRQSIGKGPTDGRHRGNNRECLEKSALLLHKISLGLVGGNKVHIPMHVRDDELAEVFANGNHQHGSQGGQAQHA